jgi:hypothetical protein
LLVPVFWWGAFVYEYYPEYFWTSAFALAVLLGVTLRMCRRWLDERRGAGYHARFAGWVALAALLVVLPIFLQRWWTTPAAMPEWRSATYAAAQRLELPPAGESMAFPIDTRFRPLAELSFLDEREREPLERAAAAVNGDNPPLLRVVDTNLSFRIRELLVAARGEFGLFGDGEPDDYYESLLEIGFHHVESLRRAPTLHRSYRADQCEFALAAELAAPESRTRLGEQAWRELVGRLRTPERRREDRRIALLFTWALSNTASMQRIDPVVEGERARQLLSDGKLIAWDDIAIWRFAEEVPSFDLDQRTFGAATWRGYRDQLTAERVRRGRFGDLAVRLSLEQLDTRLPPHNSPAAQRRREAWRAMQGMYSSRFRPTEFWSPEMEQPIEATRAMLEN